MPPKSSKTIETVVEVGRPSELKTFKSRTSVTITAEKMMSTSVKVNCEGTRTPDLAISIIPEEKVAPASTPALATAMMT